MNTSPAEEFNQKQEKLRERQDAQAYEFMYLLKLAAKATAHEGDASEKWAANAELLTWFRANPVRVIEALQAGNEFARRPGGQTTQRFIRALKRVQVCECGEVRG